MGVRISCDIFAKNVLFARLAASAASFGFDNRDQQGTPWLVASGSAWPKQTGKAGLRTMVVQRFDAAAVGGGVIRGAVACPRKCHRVRGLRVPCFSAGIACAVSPNRISSGRTLAGVPPRPLICVLGDSARHLPPLHGAVPPIER